MDTVTPDTAREVLLDCAAVHGYVERVCFKTGPPGLVGIELEWLVAFESDRDRVVPVDLIRGLLDSVPPPPHGSRITFEPGGQLELSSPPAADPSACWQAVAADVDHVRRPLAAAGVVLLPSAVDPYRPPRRQLSHPRYRAMESYFDAIGADAGPAMMNSTAAVQVNLDIGEDLDDATHRWHLLHALGPVMNASFANSPVQAGRRTGWSSTRQHIWHRLDDRRTRVPAGADPVAAWAEHALDADLMLLRRGHGDWTMAPGASFRDWVTGNLPMPPPTTDDLDYHLTTLFPPVRPRGWFEVRYVDAQPLELWPVPMAVIAALVDDPGAAAEAAEALAAANGAAPNGSGSNGAGSNGAGAGNASGSNGAGAGSWEAGRWEAAARHGLADPSLARAARGCFEIAVRSLVRNGAASDLVDLVEDFADRYVARGRCPADDATDNLRECE